MQDKSLTGFEVPTETFALRITLGNDAMSEPEHIAQALRDVAAMIDADGGIPVGRYIRDANGNAVGAFAVKS